MSAWHWDQKCLWAAALQATSPFLALLCKTSGHTFWAGRIKARKLPENGRRRARLGPGGHGAGSREPEEWGANVGLVTPVSPPRPPRPDSLPAPAGEGVTPLGTFSSFRCPHQPISFLGWAWVQCASLRRAFPFLRPSLCLCLAGGPAVPRPAPPA